MEYTISTPVEQQAPPAPCAGKKVRVHAPGARLSEVQIEQLAQDIRTFLAKWRFQDGVLLFYNGRCSSLTGCVNGSMWTETKALPQEWSDYVAKEHILTMIYDGIFYDFLYEDEPYWFDTEKLSEEVVKEIIKEFDLQPEIDDYVAEPDEADIQRREELFELSFEDPEEYRIAKYEYADQRRKQREGEIIPELLAEYRGRIHRYAKAEFNRIFDRYGLWYNFGESWSLTCFYCWAEKEYLERQTESGCEE